MKKTLIYISIGFLILVGVLGSYFVLAQGASFDPNDNRSIGYEFLDDGNVIHIWNTQDDYFFDANSGTQFTNHYQDYWAKNEFVLEAPDVGWKVFSSDLNDFNLVSSTDNENYVNLTGYLDHSFAGQGKVVRFHLTYYLGLDDENLTIDMKFENIGSSKINQDLYFGWKLTDIDVPSNETNDRIRINNTNYDLGGSYDFTFKNMTIKYASHTNWNETCLEESDFFDDCIINQTYSYEPISFYKLYDYDIGLMGNENFLRIDWNKNTDYEVNLVGDGSQENFYVSILINNGPLETGEEKSTTFYWIDALTDSLVAYYNLDETSGTTAFDSLGTNNLTNTDGVAINVAGLIDRAYDWDDVSGQMLYLADFTPYTDNNDFSISCWFNSVGTGTPQILFTESTVSADNTVALFFRLETAGTWLIFSRDNGGTTRISAAWGSNLDDGNWHNIIFTSDSSEFHTYVDGISTANTSYTKGLQSENDHISFGNRADLYELNYDGLIDECGFWVKELSFPEVEELYNSGSGFAYPFVTDTCTYSSGNWDVACSDSCIITDDVNLGGNSLILSGTGEFSLQAEIRNYASIDVWNSCNLLIESSGSIRGN